MGDQSEKDGILHPENVPDEWFKWKEMDKDKAEAVSRPSLSYWKDAWGRLLKNKLAVLGMIFLILLTLFAIFGPVFSPYEANKQDRPAQYEAPSSKHWFGTDSAGRDVFTRNWHGARISLFVGLMAALIDVSIGIAYGGISGYKGGRADNIMMRIIEILYGLPYLLVVILLLVVMGQSLTTIIIALTVTGWVGMARIVRGQVLQVKNYEFVLASKSFGAKSGRIIRKNLLPNTMGPIIVQMTLTVPTAIFAEAFLSFIGLGVQAPDASWGVMANDSLGAILSGNWWTLLFPAFFISFTMFAFNVLGDGLQDALDPRLRK